MDIYRGYTPVLNKLLEQMLEYFRTENKLHQEKQVTVYMSILLAELSSRKA